MILLDTDTLSLFHAGHQQVVQRMNAARLSDVIATTVITKAEILRGRFEFLLKASNGDEWQTAQRWLRASESLLLSLPVIGVDAKAAAEFDQLRQRKELRKLGRADMLIASIALANNAVLVTRNQRDFQRIPRLRLENWAT